MRAVLGEAHDVVVQNAHGGLCQRARDRCALVTLHARQYAVPDVVIAEHAINAKRRFQNAQDCAPFLRPDSLGDHAHAGLIIAEQEDDVRVQGVGDFADMADALH